MSAKNNFPMGGKIILLCLFVYDDHLLDNWPDRKIYIFYEKQSSPCGHQTFYNLYILRGNMLIVPNGGPDMTGTGASGHGRGLKSPAQACPALMSCCPGG